MNVETRMQQDYYLKKPSIVHLTKSNTTLLSVTNSISGLRPRAFIHETDYYLNMFRGIFKV